MDIKINIPTPLRPFTSDQNSVEAKGTTIDEALASLTAQFPGLKKHMFTDDGILRSFVNIYLNDEDIRYLQKGSTAIKDGDEITIVPSVAGGSATLPTSDSEFELSHEEIQRYSRHLIMPEVALEGQKKLKAARVLMIGAGGLGSPLGLYLAAAGVGNLGIVDFDVVDESNLQRQILHTTSDIGRSKLESAKESLLAINPNIDIETYEMRLSSDNALELFEKYDIVVDGTDNFPTRYLVNDACALAGKPNVYASIFRFEGQASIFYADEGPCYRCLYPEPPPPGLVPSCAEGGVLGILPGLLGIIQATETIKLILGTGESLIGRLLLVDALNMNFRELKLKKDPDCLLCGSNATITELIDYDDFCGISAQPNITADSEYEITPIELKRRLDSGDEIFILDVREPQEWEICRLDNTTLIPLGQLPNRMHELDSADDIVVHCKVGARSGEAVQLLKNAGFRKIKNLVGGIDQWTIDVDPSLPRY
jgi:adenylyltransferase/sulfurtransferase